MFTKGDYVVYGLDGVCRIEGIETPDIMDIPKDKKYYVLFPVSQSGKIYVPVNSAESKMRNVISKREAEELISKLQEIEPLKTENEKTAEELYKKCIKSYDCTEWVRLIKYIYQRKQKRSKDGKKMTARDEKYMKMAEEALYSELGIALDVPKEQMLEYIIARLK